MKLIVGLGNPGPKYELTRHNIGFLSIDYIADELGLDLNKSKWKGLYAEGVYQGEKIILLKPMTFMNLSGESIQEVMNFYKIPVENILIIFDDLDLPFGKIKLRYKGSSGGHNGLKSIIAHLGTDQFKRIKMGIGRPEFGDTVSYVLGQFPLEQQDTLEEMLAHASKASTAFIGEDDFTKVMNKYNG
ncbi:aminoacyl-tRNA hydrolase [Bacillus horti]|uniref:Peptidyl-tRNA hydrolase n=1 Tax=Caldalkalibacillus horti TaxID=77523 RepID=A0ABT9W2W6_9BACI|nr:aminoacyl-tRNA hydrolase [Bacillus horti]MDQ0167581.1 PTH1 family peptidyl-tRNA hydrolase [Bacillus horti]